MREIFLLDLIRGRVGQPTLDHPDYINNLKKSRNNREASNIIYSSSGSQSC